MNKKIVFIGVAIHFAKYQYAIGKELEKKGVEVSYVTYSKEAEIFLKKLKADVAYIPDFSDKKILQKSVDSYLREFEIKYNTNSELILFGDYEHSMMPRKKALKTMVKNFMFWEEYVEKHKPTMVIGSAERYPGMIPDVICKYHKIRYYWWTRGPFDNTFVLTQHAKEGYWSALDSYWKKNKNASKK